MLRRAPVLLAIAFLSAPAHAQGTDWAKAMAEAEWDWHPGDLIFRNGINDLDELLRDAEGGAWASVGILRASSGGPRVVYADQDQGVTEVMLYEFVDGLGPDDYAVYRIDALDPNRPGQQMQMGPVATYALTVAYGAGFDSHMLPGDDSFYNAELPFLAAGSARVVLADPIPLERLGAASPAFRDAMLADWQTHPRCAALEKADDCWEKIKGTVVITPGRLTASDHTRQVFP